ncbi:hypothetical protein D3C84_738260 [compost metagenome]
MDTEGHCRPGVARYCNEVPIQLGLGATLGQVPATRGLGVLQGLQGAEGFRRDDEQGGFGAQLGGQFVERAAIDIGQVMAAHATLGERQQGFGDQLRAEEGTADADIHHVGDRLLAVAAPQAVVHPPDQFGHLVQHPLHLGHHVDAIDQHLVADRPAQRGVQGRAGLGGIDRLTVELRPNGLLQSAFLGQADQQVAGFQGDQVFRVVEKQAAATQRKVLETLRVHVERLAHAEALQAGAVFLEGLPAGQGGDIEGMLVVRHVGWLPCA